MQKTPPTTSLSQSRCLSCIVAANHSILTNSAGQTQNKETAAVAKLQIFSIDSGPFTFSFDSFPSRNEFRDLVKEHISRNELSASAPPEPRTADPKVVEMRDARTRILESNKDLQKLHHALVLGKDASMSEEEFWLTRGHTIREYIMQKKQMGGVNSAMLSFKPTQMADGQKAKFRLEQEDIQKIMFLYPEVQDAYNESVTNANDNKETKDTKDAKDSKEKVLVWTALRLQSGGIQRVLGAILPRTSLL